MVHERMNQITGIQCNKVQGAMYAFPKVDIPEEAWEDAKVSRQSSMRLQCSFHVHPYTRLSHACMEMSVHRHICEH